MRNMSFALTTNQVRSQSKRVTRRNGWWNLKAGEIVQPVVKGMGLKKGEKIEKIGCPIRILSTRPEALLRVTDAECVLEGFPEMNALQFIGMYSRHNGCGPDELVNRIEFEYVDAVK
jgi:hypothetical protein